MSSLPISRTTSLRSKSIPLPKWNRKSPSLFSETKEYDGQRLTLNFQDIETRAVLQLLAETSGKNIVVSDTVQPVTSRCACATFRGTRHWIS